MSGARSSRYSSAFSVNYICAGSSVLFGGWSNHRFTTLTTQGPRRAEILVSFSPLNKYSFLYLPQDGSVLKLSTHCRVFRVPHGTIQNPKYWFLGVLVARSFYPHKLLSAQAHNFCFQGALPSGDWVFNVVEYPSHITILSRPRIKSRPKRTRL